MTSLSKLIGAFLNGPLNLFECFVFRTRFSSYSSVLLVATLVACCFRKCSVIFLAVSMHVFKPWTVSFCRLVPQGSGEQPDRTVCFYRGVYLSVHMLVCVCVCRSSHLWRTDSRAERVLLASCLCTHRPPFPTSPWACQPPAPPA